jgi:iron complex transport system substrate-binding protein
VPQPTAAPAASSFPLTFTDDAGRKVTLAKEPRRIISLASSNTEILFALGLGDRVVGVDQYSDYPDAAKEKPKVGSFVQPDMEKILALEPDLVLATEMHLQTVVPELERRGLTTMVVNPKGVMAVLQDIRLVGRTTGRRDEAEKLAGSMETRIASVEARTKGTTPVRTFFELSPDLHTAGPGSFVDDMIRLAGGSNVAAGAGKEWPQLSQEALLLADPEVILLADHGSSGGQSPQSVAARPGWQQVTAVKTGRVFEIDPDLTNRAGPRVVDGLEMIADRLHPSKP